jgi:DNA mismatch repair protein MutS2
LDKEELIAKSTRMLGWEELRSQLASLSLSPTGRERCLNLKPEEDLEKVRYSIRLTSEMTALLQKGERFPLSEFEDLRPLFNRLENGKILEPPELGKISSLLGVSERVKNFLQQRFFSCPELNGLGNRLEALSGLRHRIDRSIDVEGRVREDATERLITLHKEVRYQREEIIRKLDTFIKDPASEHILQDRYYTQRDGRFVIPVISGQKMDGIVHDLSSSGSTRFVEPSWLVDSNNVLRVSLLEIQKEIEKILRDLSHVAREALQLLDRNLTILSEIDLVLAKANLSERLQASEPILGSEDVFTLNDLRHPLLVLSRDKVVPNDIHLNRDNLVLVISGPNAGGKTATLKALGLSVLMARAGLHIPFKAGSTIPFVSEIYADIGDEQDLERDISTFSGHIINILSIINVASKGSLILLDELAGSTDPVEGAALAAAILEAMTNKGARTVVTTHYSYLKALADGKKGYMNASLEFDGQTLRPTYRLLFGLPGQSSPIEIASRLGFPGRILSRAREFLRGRGPSLEGIIRELETKRQAMESAKRAALIEREQAENYREEEQKILAGLQEEEKQFKMTKRKRLEREISQARSRIREIAKGLQDREILTYLQTKRQALRDLEDDLKLPSITRIHREPLPINGLRIGDKVDILPLGQSGILLEDPSKKKAKSVRVQTGSVELTIDKRHLSGVDRTGGKDRKSGNKRANRDFSGDIPMTFGLSTEIDIRGMTSEEALAETEKNLDMAYLGRLKEIKIIHGHGTGVLKKAVRDYLGSCPYAVKFVSGNPREGGDGVTVVILRQGEE